MQISHCDENRLGVGDNTGFPPSPIKGGYEEPFSAEMLFLSEGGSLARELGASGSEMNSEMFRTTSVRVGVFLHNAYTEGGLHKDGKMGLFGLADMRL